MAYLLVGKYGKTGQPFKVSTLSRWILIVTNPDIVNEVKDSERDLSFSAAISEVTWLLAVVSQLLIPVKAIIHVTHPHG